MILKDDTFNQTIQDQDIILVDFWADWCGPCKRLNPILEEISQETGLLIGKLNIDENSEIPLEYDVQSIPTMVLFVGGKPVHRITGAMPKHKLLRELSEWL